MASTAPASETTHKEIVNFALTADRSRRLKQVADIRQTSETEVVERALDLYFSLSVFFDHDIERRDWHQLSESALGRVWDNERDAVYDDWKALYGAPEG